MARQLLPRSIFFFLNDPATTEIYPLPLHDALPIFGISQFHRLITTKLRTAMETTASATNAAPFTTQRPRPLTTSSSPRLPIRCRQSTDFGARQPLVPDRSQPLLQIEHRVALAREQRVETHSRARRQLLEADALDLVRYEYLALLRRQLRERRLDLGEQQLAHERGLRSAVRGRKQILEHRLQGGLVLRRPRRRGLALRRPRRASLDSLATKPIDDAIARHPSERSEERRVGKECRSRWSPY